MRATKENYQLGRMAEGGLFTAAASFATAETWHTSIWPYVAAVGAYEFAHLAATTISYTKDVKAGKKVDFGAKRFSEIYTDIGVLIGGAALYMSGNTLLESAGSMLGVVGLYGLTKTAISSGIATGADNLFKRK